MRPLRLRRNTSLVIAGFTSLSVMATVVTRHRATFEVIGGAMILWASASLGSRLANRLGGETDPRKILVLNLWLILTVLLALSGMALIGLAVPGD